MCARGRSRCCWRSAAWQPIRDLLLRVMRQQNPDGDWPQWFMFFERERDIRAGDSHGDIVFWPLLVLAQYLIASGDAGDAGERVAFFDARGPEAGEQRDGVAARAARAGADRQARHRRALRWLPTATATGTTRCSRPIRRCAITCAAPGP